MPNTLIAAAVISPTQGRSLNILGHQVRLVLGQQHTGGKSYVMEVVTPGGHGIPPHVHTVEDEVIQVLEGDYEVLLGDQVHLASAGATLHFPVGVVHAFKNTGKSPGRTLWFVSPGSNFEMFFDKLDALPQNGPPDMGLIAGIFAEHGMTILTPGA